MRLCILHLHAYYIQSSQETSIRNLLFVDAIQATLQLFCRYLDDVILVM